MAEIATLMRQCLSHAREAWSQAVDRLPADDVLQATAATMLIECGKKGVRPTMVQIRLYTETLKNEFAAVPAEEDGLPF